MKSSIRLLGLVPSMTLLGSSSTEKGGSFLSSTFLLSFRLQPPPTAQSIDSTSQNFPALNPPKLRSRCREFSSSSSVLLADLELTSSRLPSLISLLSVRSSSQAPSSEPAFSLSFFSASLAQSRKLFLPFSPTPLSSFNFHMTDPTSRPVFVSSPKLLGPRRHQHPQADQVLEHLQ